MNTGARARTHTRLIYSVINYVDLINFNGSLARDVSGVNITGNKVASTRPCHYRGIYVVCALLKVLIETIKYASPEDCAVRPVRVFSALANNHLIVAKNLSTRQANISIQIGAKLLCAEIEV